MLVAQEGAELERSKTLPGLMPGSYGTGAPGVYVLGRGVLPWELCR